MQQQSAISSGDFELRVVRPSLEDVFVTSTDEEIL